ncbi:MAG TPA: hypothetical protein VMR41_05560, partial [Patescibacteria group bacterium]|nr:hypothetical protein [Patescibacteria group bacterium]
TPTPTPAPVSTNGGFLYMRLGITPQVSYLPSGFYSAWNLTQNSYAGGNAKALSLNMGSSQMYNTLTYGPIPANSKMGLAQFVSAPLTSQGTIPAGNWRIGFGGYFKNGNLYPYNGAAALYLYSSSGTYKQTIISLTNVGGSRSCSSNYENNMETDTASGSSFTPSAGDYLVLEVGMANTCGYAIGSSSNTQTYTFYSDGSQPAGTDNSSCTQANYNAAGQILPPWGTSLYFSLSQ